MTTTNRLSKREIIQETRAYYENNQRAYYGGCHYFVIKNGIECMCAVGRCLDNPKELKDCGKFVSEMNIENILKDKYKGHENDFWVKLQHFHDQNLYWEKTKKGNRLTDMGLEFYNDLLEKYNEDNKS